MRARTGVFCGLVALLVWGGAASPLRGDSFEESVQKAVQEGVRSLYRDVSITRQTPLEKIYPLGTRALTAYALLESDVPVDSRLIQDLFDEMEECSLRRVYSVAVYVMALDAILRRLEGTGAASGGDESGEERRRRRILDRMEKSVEWLVRSRLRGRGIWGYGPIRPNTRLVDLWVDFSNTQFASLAFQIAYRHEIEIPSRALREMAETFIDSMRVIEKFPRRSPCEGAGWWVGDSEMSAPTGDSLDAPIVYDRNGFVLQGRCVGWGYRPRWNGGGPYTYSMTSAVVSSLMVIRYGLASQQALKPEERDTIDRAVAAGILTLDRDFTALGPDRFGNTLRNYYYTLYSFEKVMDLGGITKLNGKDWYREQGLKLLAEQRRDGAWGSAIPGTDRDYDRTSTAFALLFLNRATRSLLLEAAAPIVSGGGEDSKEGLVSQGKVYIPSRDGVASLDDLFERIRSRRTATQLDLVREVVESVPPEELVGLLPYLARARNRSGDSLDRYLEETIYEISGLPGSVLAPRLESWVERYREVERWGAEADLARVPELVLVLRTDAETAPVQLRAIDSLVRIGSLDGVEGLLAALESRRPRVRESAQRGLQSLVPGRVSYDPLAPPEERAQGAARWRDYWTRHEEELRFALRWSRLRAELDAATDAGVRQRLRSEIAALGEKALPEIEEILRTGSFAFDWLKVWEEITGRPRGF